MIPKNVIYYSLKYCRAISYIKEHYQEFEESIVSVKCGLLLVTYFDMYMVKVLANIQFCKKNLVLQSYKTNSEMREI